MKINFPQARFIKLGQKGKWEKDCIEGSSPCIKLGFCSNLHRESLAGDWDTVRRYYLTKEKKTEGKATEFANQVRAFYEATEQTLWITFYKRKLYWCFASKTVEELPDGHRIRRAIAPRLWSCKDVNGNELHIDGLSGALTKVQGFRGTICEVEQADYLRKRLNGERLPEVEQATKLLGQLEASLLPLIQMLTWKDFELLCDLVFTQAGWQRISTLGKQEKTIDMELLSPVTQRKAMVQVKSQAGKGEFLDYKAKFESAGYDEMYFVVHTPSEDLATLETPPHIFILTGERLAKLIVSAGLSRWLLQKTT